MGCYWVDLIQVNVKLDAMIMAGAITAHACVIRDGVEALV